MVKTSLRHSVSSSLAEERETWQPSPSSKKKNHVAKPQPSPSSPRHPLILTSSVPPIIAKYPKYHKPAVADTGRTVLLA